MFDTTADGIMKLAAQGESQIVEFKEHLPTSDSIAKVLISFANASGGILLIGIKDNGEISGITAPETLLAIKRLNHICNSLFTWPSEIATVNVRGKNVSYAVVNEAPREYRPIMSATGDVYKRKGERIVRIIRRKIEETPLTLLPKEKQIRLFVAMSFRDEEEPYLVDYFKAIERAANATKLPIYVYRIDLVEGDYEISQRIMDEIDKCDIIITDFTLNPRNVYFELGYARGKGSCKVIQTARKDTTLEFDVRNWKTVFYRNATELENKLIPELKSVCDGIKK